MKSFLKTIALLVIIAAFTISSLSAATYTTGKSTVISVDPIDLLVGGKLNATYETMFGGANNSLTINASWNNYSEWMYGIGLGASYRWYIDLFDEGKKSLNGLSIGPRLDIWYWSWDKDWYNNASLNYKNPSLGLGAEINYKWVFKDKWVVEPTLKFVIPIMKSGFTYNGYGLGVNVGYAF